MHSDEDKKAAEDYYSNLSLICVMAIRESFRSNNLGDLLGQFVKDTFLAGIAHARKPHVVADGDLPPVGQQVLQYAEGRGCFVGFLLNSAKDKIKYWWPLPE